MNILVVDDELGYLMLISDLLKQEGHTVFSAKHGGEALEVLEDNQIDFIICDVYMPVMDGLKFHKTIRAMPQFKETPFLFVSGFDDDYTRSAVTLTKADGFLRKVRPFDEMVEWIQYLTTPVESRPKLPPGKDSRSGTSSDRYNPRSKRTSR